MATSWKPRERRMRKRIAVRFSESANSPGGIGFTTNVSFHGLCIAARTVHLQGTLLRVDIQIAEGNNCRATGTVVWSKPALPHLALPGSMGVRVESAEPGYRRYLQLLHTREAEAEPPELVTPPGPTVRLRTRTVAERQENPSDGRARPVQSERAPINLEALFEDEADLIEEGLLLPIDEGETTPSQSAPPAGVESSTLRRVVPVPTHGHLIAVVGVDGSDKAELLQAALRRLGRDVIALSDLGKMGVTPEQIVDAERAAVETGHHRIVLSPHTLFDVQARRTGDAPGFWKHARSSAIDQQGRYYAVIFVRPPIVSQGGSRGAVQAQRTLEAAWDGHPRRLVVDWHADIEQRVMLFERHVSQYLPKSGKGLPPPVEVPLLPEPPTRMAAVRRNGGPLIHRDRSPRLHARLPVRYGRARPLTFSGTTVNFSRSGFAFLCETALAQGEPVLFTIDLPGGEPCRGSGTVVWSSAVRGIPGVALGVRLRRVHESYFRLLEELLRGAI